MSELVTVIAPPDLKAKMLAASERRQAPRAVPLGSAFVTINTKRYRIADWSRLGLKFGPVETEFEIGMVVPIDVVIDDYRVQRIQFHGFLTVLRVSNGEAAGRYNCRESIDASRIDHYFRVVIGVAASRPASSSAAGGLPRS